MSTENSRTLLFGGSFNPVHNGHLGIARSAADLLNVQRVVLIPAGNPPHKSNRGLAASDDRLAMCRLAIQGEAQFEVSDWETLQSGPSYTLRTVEHLQAIYPGQLYWLLGMDSLLELHTWYRIDELAAACTLATVGRPGFEPGLDHLESILQPDQISHIERHILRTQLFDISATDIRARLRAGLSIAELVHPQVADYIAQARLYAD